MYLLESMVELGLKDDQTFPTEDHRKVAAILTIGNRYVKDRGMLTEVVQAVIRVPTERIRTVTPEDLYNEFECPNVW